MQPEPKAQSLTVLLKTVCYNVAKAIPYMGSFASLKPFKYR